MSSKTQIKKLERQRQKLIQELLDTQEMIRGSFGKVMRKCGKPNCWCAEGDGHPLNRITWTEKGRPRAKTIPGEDAAWVATMTAHYKRFRKNRQALRALDKRLNNEIDELEAKLDDKTRQRKAYLK
jgi:hypothetical protein